MATHELNVINAVLTNKDVHHILGVDSEVFGAYKDVAEFIRRYYVSYKSIPGSGLMKETFPDIEFDKTTGSTDFYLKRLREQHVKVRMQQIMLKAGQALNEDASSFEVFDKFMSAMTSLGKFANVAKDVDITDADWVKEHFKHVREAASLNDGTPGISTGFQSIDLAYPTGLAPGHSIVLMGYTSRGKSMFSDLLAVKVWDQGYKPMIVSLEMSPTEQMERIYAMMSSGLFKTSDLARGNISMDAFDEWSGKRFAPGNSFVVVSSEGISEVTPNVIQSKIDVHHPDIVILDYAQLMMDNAKSKGMTDRMRNLSREIKMLAVSNGIPTILITSVTDDDGNKRDEPPMLHQVAWSAALEYDANLVMAAHRHDDTDLVEIVGRKNRHGPLFDFYLSVDWDAGVWTEEFDI